MRFLSWGTHTGQAVFSSMTPAKFCPAPLEHLGHHAFLHPVPILTALKARSSCLHLHVHKFLKKKKKETP